MKEEDLKYKKSFWNYLIEPSRVVVFLLGVLCMLAGMYGLFVPTITNSVPALGFLKSLWGRVALEFVGWGSFIYTARELCWTFKKTDDKKKFWLSATVLSWVVFTYSVSRILKNSLSVDLGDAGTSTGKIFVIITSILYGFYMAWVNNKFSLKRLILFVLMPINLYFLLFFFVLLKPEVSMVILPGDAFCDWYAHTFLNNIFNVKCVKYWPNFIFYIFAETMALPCMAAGYQIFNANVDRKTAKRWLVPLLIVVQFATMLSGFMFETSGDSTNYLSEYGMAKREQIVQPGRSLREIADRAGYYDIHYYRDGPTKDQEDLKLLGSCCVLVATIVVFVANYFLFLDYVPEAQLKDSSGVKKKKLSVSEVLSVAFSNKIYLSFAALTICFALSSSQIEQVWQSSLRASARSVTSYFFYNSEPQSSLTPINAKIFSNISSAVYRSLYSNYMINQGRATMFLLIGVTNVLAKLLSWKNFSLILPIAMYIFAGLFFGIILIVGGPTGTLFGYQMLPIVVSIGTICLLFLKSFKVAGGDYTREVAVSFYSNEEKGMIKSVEAGLGRFGKTGSAILFYILASWLGIEYTTSSAAILFLIAIFSCGIWWISSLMTINQSIEEAEKIEAMNDVLNSQVAK